MEGLRTEGGRKFVRLFLTKSGIGRADVAESPPIVSSQPFNPARLRGRIVNLAAKPMLKVLRKATESYSAYSQEELATLRSKNRELQKRIELLEGAEKGDSR